MEPARELSSWIDYFEEIVGTPPKGWYASPSWSSFGRHNPHPLERRQALEPAQQQALEPARELSWTEALPPWTLPEREGEVDETEALMRF